MKKIILYGAGNFGKEALNELGPERVEFFCDTGKWGTHCGIPIINLQKLKEIHNGYEVIVTTVDVAAREEISGILKRNKIPFSYWGGRMSAFVHIHGKFPEILFEYQLGSPGFMRAETSMGMYQKMFRTFSEEFRGRSFDIWFSHEDSPQTAYDMSLALSLTHIHAYSTIWPLRKRVVPIPDFSCYIDEESDPIRVFAPQKCREAAKKPWSDPRAYWRGNLYSSDNRKWLYLLGKEYPDRLCIESSGSGKFLSLLEQVKYKYLIDVRGYSWTDRLKTLLQLGRPVLLVDRPYREWYFDYMEPMVHYVPVKEDLSDLIERIDYLDTHPEEYDRIVANAAEFCQKYIVGRPVLEYLRDVTLKYDVVDEIVERNAPWNPETYRKERLLLD